MTSFLKNKDMDDFISLISCPMSGKIFNYPVLSKENGNVYEGEILMNEEPSAIIVLPLKSFIISFLEKFPEFKKQQYEISPENMYSHIYNINNINNDIIKKKYDTIIKYNKFSLKLFNNVANMLNELDDNIWLHIINNLIDYYEKITIDNYNYILLDYILALAPNKLILINCLVDKMDINSVNQNNSPVLQRILRYSNDNELILKIVNRNPNYYIEDNNGVLLGVSVFKKCCFEIIEKILNMIDSTSEDFIKNKYKFIEKIKQNTNLTSDQMDLLIYNFN